MRNMDKQEKVLLALDEHKWINTPVVYTTYGNNFTSFQQDLMLIVSGHFQDYLKKFLDDKSYKNKENPNPMIPKEVVKAMPPIHIDLSEMGIGDNNYSRVDVALNAIRELWAKAPVFDKESGLKTGEDMFPVFKKVHIPTIAYNVEGNSLKYKNKEGLVIDSSNRRKGYIELTINEEVSSYVFDMHDGYFNHLERIAMWCKSRYTSRLYLLLMRYVSRNNMNPVIRFSEIKEFLGVVERDPKTGVVIKENYRKYSQFSKMVLNVAKMDMDKLSNEHHIEILLDDNKETNGYRPIYTGRGERGNPDAIQFFIKRSALGLARDTELHRSSSEQKLLSSLLGRYPTLSKDAVLAFFNSVPNNRWSIFQTYVYKDIPKLVENPHRWNGTAESYIMFLIRKKCESLTQNIAKSIQETNSPSPTEISVDEEINPHDVKTINQACPIKSDMKKIGEFKEEWETFLLTYKGCLLPLIAKAKHMGSDRGFPWIEFPDKISFDEYERAELNPKNADEVKKMRSILASILHIESPVVIIVRGYKS